jgi:hypothetical protein
MIMRFLTALVLASCLAFSAWSQTTTLPPPQQALSQVRQYLGLTDSQVTAILQNNSDYNTFSFQQQDQIRQAQSQIAVEIAKDPLDPPTIGNLYAGIETTCRGLRDKAAVAQQQNISILTDTQRAKLNMLNDALKLVPTISEAQSGNLLGSTNSPPFAFSALSSGIIAGVVGFPPVPGCNVNVVPTLAFRSGDFSPVPPVNGNAIQPNHNFVTSSDPANRLFVDNGNPRLLPSPSKWFSRTQP